MVMNMVTVTGDGVVLINVSDSRWPHHLLGLFFFSKVNVDHLSLILFSILYSTESTFSPVCHCLFLLGVFCVCF